MSDAEERLKEAVALHLDTLEGVGEREKFFKKHHIVYHAKKPPSNVQITASTKGDTFVKPYTLMMPQFSFA